MIDEFIDFIKFEKHFGYRVLLKDLFLINKLYFKRYFVKKILDFTEENKLKFTFFISAKNLNKKEWLVKQLLEQGHEIASHGYNHVLLGEKSYSYIYDDFKKAAESFKKFKIKPTGFRPPFLSANDCLIKLAKKFDFDYISSKQNEGIFKYTNGLIEIPIISPYDWYGIVVKNMPFKQVLKEWESKKGTLLLHPWIIYNYLNDLKCFISKNRDYRIAKNKRGLGISFDLY